MANEIGFGLNDKQFAGDDIEKYKGVKGKKHRIGLVHDIFQLPDETDPSYKKILAKIKSGHFEKNDEDTYRMVRLYQNNVHKYIQGIGYLVESENSTDILTEYAKKYKAEHKHEKNYKDYDPVAAPRFATLVVQYGVDPKTGAFPEDDDENLIYTHELKLWTFGLNIFKKLQNIDMDYPLIKHDLRIECSNEDFQHLEIINAKESLWREDAKREKKVLAEAKKFWPKAKSSVGRTMTDDAIRDKLNLEPVGVAIASSASDDDFDTIAEDIA